MSQTRQNQTVNALLQMKWTLLQRRKERERHQSNDIKKWKETLGIQNSYVSPHQSFFADMHANWASSVSIVRDIKSSTARGSRRRDSKQKVQVIPYPIQCPCWKTYQTKQRGDKEETQTWRCNWYQTKQIHLRIGWYDDGILAHARAPNGSKWDPTSLSTKMHASPHWVDSSRLSHSSRDIQLMAMRLLWDTRKP